MNSTFSCTQNLPARGILSSRVVGSWRSKVFVRGFAKIAAVAAVAGLLAGCDNDTGVGNARAIRPIPPDTLALMEQKGTSKSAPVLIRAYKKEAEFEMWKMKPDGRYVLLKTFPMCRWSGQLGPKTREGDRQVPEGFYNITPGQMNPDSHYYLSFNVGYPNAFDRAYGRGGGSIMVHGACSSMGCFSMTDQQIAEIYAIAREGFSGGQRSIQMQSLPFRMTAENLAKHRLDPNIGFWKQLKQGADHFEVARQEPKVGVCNKHYVFNAQPAGASQQLDANGVCPPLAQDQELLREVAAKETRDDAAVAELVSKGVKPVRVLYADGGQHPDFARLIADVSRPDALAQGPVEIALGEDKVKKPEVVQMAAAKVEAVRIDGQRAKDQSTGTSLARSNAPAPALPSDAVAATAFAPVPAPADEATPFYKRWLGMDAAADPVKAAPAEVVEPAVPQPADVPLPPRRRQATVAVPKQPTPRPQAKLRQMPGAPAPLPGDFMAFTPVGE